MGIVRGAATQHGPVACEQLVVCIGEQGTRKQEEDGSEQVGWTWGMHNTGPPPVLGVAGPLLALETDGIEARGHLS